MKVKIICKVCERKIIRTSNSQKYCKFCGMVVSRASTKHHAKVKSRVNTALWNQLDEDEKSKRMAKVSKIFLEKEDDTYARLMLESRRENREFISPTFPPSHNKFIRPNIIKDLNKKGGKTKSQERRVNYLKL